MTIIDSGIENEIFNICGGFEQSNLETITKVIKLYYNDIVDINTYVDLSYNRQGQDVRYALDDSKLRSLGWKPEHDFDTELEKIVNYYRHKFIW
jgi:dTDP-glucose 4,6-dehydratase